MCCIFFTGTVIKSFSHSLLRRISALQRGVLQACCMPFSKGGGVVKILAASSPVTAPKPEALLGGKQEFGNGGGR